MKGIASNYDHRYLEDLSNEIEPFIDRTSISGEEEQEAEKPNLRTPPSRPWFHKAMHALILIFTISLGVVVSSILISDSKSSEASTAPEPQYEGGSKVLAQCGTNPEEAQALGCVWDIICFGWVYPTCFDQAESDSWYAKYGPWDWYTEKPGNGTDAVRLTPDA